jgi:hypothetical protein
LLLPLLLWCSLFLTFAQLSLISHGLSRLGHLGTSG